MIDDVNAYNRSIYWKDPELARKQSNERHAGYYAADPEKFRARRREWTKQNRDKIAEYKQRPEVKARSRERMRERRKMLRSDPIWVELQKCSSRKAHLKRLYGLSEDEFNQMLADQLGKCKICKAETTRNGTSTKFHVDHCHATGKVRGLLCGRCNLTIGRCGDSASLMRSMADYIELHA